MINPPNTGHMRLMVDAARGLQAFQPSTRPITTAGKPNDETDRIGAAARIKQETQAIAGPEEFKTRRNIYDEKDRNITPKDKSTTPAADDDNGAAGATASADAVATKIENQAKSQKQPRFCHSCGQDCTRIHYLRSGPAAPGLPQSYRLCPNCRGQGRFQHADNKASWVKIEDVNYDRSSEQGAEWSDSEIYLLLHALDSEEDDWHKIAKFVGSRSAEECVQKFLQLEIEDKYIVRADNQEATHNVPPYGRIPYNNVENPIMTVVSFLAAQSDKNVAAAAANRAVQAMKQSLQRQMQNGDAADGDSKEKNKDSSKGEREDAMDVDAPSNDKESAGTELVSTDKSATSTSLEVSTGNPTTDLATMSLATSAARAAALASHEERQMTTLVSAALNSTLEKLDLKLKQFQEMEACLQMERLELEKAQQQLFLDRLAFKKKVKDVQELVRKGAIASGAATTGNKLPGLEEKLGFETIVTGRAEEDGRMGTNMAGGLEMPTEGLKVKEI